IRDIKIAVGVESETSGIVEASLLRRTAIAAKTLGPVAGVGRNDAGGVDLADHVIVAVGNIQIARGVVDHPPGKFILAFVAAPPSPLYPATPLPAMVEMIPAVVIFLTLLLRASAKTRFPAASVVIERGVLILAERAGPPSPLNPAIPVPA